MNFSSLWKGARGAAKAAWGSPVGRSSIIGAGIGGAYGGVSDNTSVLGGAAAGALLGGVGRQAWSTGKIGINSYRTNLAKNLAAGAPSGMARGNAASIAANRMWRGNTLMANRAINSISSTLKGWGL